jgi:outer membrane protein TolC
VYRLQQSLQSSASLSLSQNFELTGGTFTIDSDLRYLRNYGESTFAQFSTTPFRIGYSQSLFGFNSLKWEKKIEALKFEKAKKQFLYQLQEIAENAVSVFFDLALAQMELEIAQETILSLDTLYQVGLERQRISAIPQSELLTLELDLIYAQNTVESAKLNLERVEYQFLSFLNMDKRAHIKIELPQQKNKIMIPVEAALLYAKENHPDYSAFRQEILEAERELERNRKNAGFDSRISASIGFNQTADNFIGSYTNPSQQDVISLSVNIPLLDWGLKKGRMNMAKNSLDIAKISVRQREDDMEQTIISAIHDFNLQQDRIISAARALQLAKAAYNNVKDRFTVGKSDVNSLTIALSRQKEAQRNYLSTSKNYWLGYFRLRRLTLFDFEVQKPLSGL